MGGAPWKPPAAGGPPAGAPFIGRCAGGAPGGPPGGAAG